VGDIISQVLHQSDPVFGGAGLAVALFMLLLLLVLLPRQRRNRLAVPVWMLVGHTLCGAALVVLPTGLGERRLAVLLSASLLLASIGRSSFLLLVDAFWNRRSKTPVPQILRDVLQATLFVLISLLALRAAGVEPGSLLTTSALLTAVIGLSLQETLGNLFAGLAIQAQRPFDVGDWIQFDENHIGKVLGINWRATRVLTIEDVEVIVPNGNVAKAPIFNFSRPTPRVRRKVEIGTVYEASPSHVREVLLASLDNVRGVLGDPPPSVVTKDFSDSGVIYELRFFIDDFALRDAIDGEVRDRIWYALKRANLPIPFPTRRLEFAAPEPAAGERPSDRAAEALVGHSELFQHLSQEDTRELASHAERRLYACDEKIVRQGESGAEMFLIEHGNVRVTTESLGPAALAELGRGEFFGEMSLMTGEARSADVTASEETSVLVIHRNALAPILQANPKLAETIGQALAERAESLTASQSLERMTRETVPEHELLKRIRGFFGL
jgi:small-conductance mechanosensitive channel/CRP-like cAMP-binding protein